MRYTFILLALFCSLVTGKAQLFTPGGTLQGSSLNNNVGIGTNSPIEKLQVNGNGRFITNLSGINYLIKIGGNTHLANNAFGISFDPEGYADGYNYRSKTAIVVEGDDSGWSRGKLHILQKNTDDNNPADLSNSVLTIDRFGKVGVGTTNPIWKLHVKGAITADGDGVYGYPDFNLKNGNMRWHISGPRYGEGNRLGIFWNDGTSYFDYFTIRTNGNVGIGTTNPQNLLDVNGTIHAREVKVDLAGWSDFVFHPSYQLKPLMEVEKFIKANGHLQDIPSAVEVEQNGVNVGEMQKKLLQKVEELTLYVIEKDKQLAEQQKVNAAQEKINKEQQQMLLQMKEKLDEFEKK